MIEVRQLTGHLTVTVTPVDIDHGDAGNCIRCPLAIALTRDHPINGSWLVMDRVVLAHRKGDRPGTGREWPLPEPLRKAIRAFDLTGASFAGEWSLDEQADAKG